METRRRSRPNRSWVRVLIGLVAVVVVLAGAVVWRSVAAYRRVEGVRTEAIQRHAGSEVEAVLAFLTDGANSLADQNRAIYLLGELRDESAVEVLETLLTGQVCDHSRFVCQREVEKSLAKIGGEIPEAGPIWDVLRSHRDR